MTTEKNDIVINIRHLRKAFGGVEILKDVNLQLNLGENLAILGRSGQGKSVTIKCIVGLIMPDSGSIEVFGKEIANLDEAELKDVRTKIGFLFQGSALYDSMTVKENLAFPMERALSVKNNAEINKRIAELLEDVGLADTINKMPSELSGGMRKRIALARMLIIKPDIMLYDEPTTGLDPLTSKEISELIADIQKKYTSSSIIITHDISCARITSDRILVLDNGEFIAEGTFSELEQSTDSLVRAFFK